MSHPAFAGPARERDLEHLLAQARSARGTSLWADAARRLGRDRAALASLFFLVVLALASFLAPLLPLPSPMALALIEEPAPPVPPWESLGRTGWSRADYWELGALDELLLSAREKVCGDWQTGPWLGTDAKGRDLLARIVWGSRISLEVALAAALVSLFVGVAYGAVAGYAGGRIDNWMMRLVDVLYSVPFIFVVIFLITVLNEYRDELAAFGIQSLHVFFVVIGLVWWLTMARVVRGQVLALKNAEFVQAARALGASGARILFKHLVPNVFSVVIVYLTLTIPSVMLFEAFLSFLGLGIEPPRVSWGQLALDCTEAISALKTFWWLVCFPAGAIGATLLALTVLGDGLRDALDPKLRERC